MSLPDGNSTYIICTLATCPIDDAFVDYLPSLAGNATYLAIFAILWLAQVYLGIRYRTWGFLATMAVGGLLEIAGYLGRILLHSDPFNFNYFLIYLICLTIGPTLLSAALYLCLARVIVAYGTEFSRFQPRTYTLTFISCDFASLVLQCAGGGITATSGDQATSDAGVHIMVAGLALQVSSLVLFMILCLEYAWQVRHSPKQDRFMDLRSTGSFRVFKYALAVSTVAIFIRSVYRVAELSGGFGGALANNQTSFMVLEGPMVIIAVLAMTLFHPGICFNGHWVAASWTLRGKH
ncbi:Sphingoid long-chain base transporter [Lachnellula hyalina]|uniref:Sphingoid long-chain base transporter n=1 Tax=Lachnellula hyalina TaxID=1316788 RepID=A0A8H8QXU4_9HELO|nr:Sphingoid long-chain base transporter [Lachnellula hyalina]TVY24036.1 Sphingoid long-chain base transporter [Lachnellula hyalina]